MGTHVHEAIILGAGLGGVGTAAQLARNGFGDFLVFEKADRVGGVWRDNNYPGAACDTQSHVYCYSFFLNLRVSKLFAGRDELLAYVDAIVDEFELTDRIRLGEEIVRASWIENDAVWEIETVDGSRHLARVFVPAWGQLGAPYVPHFAGMETFQGEVFHSSRWNHEIALQNKRVASIGAAASAVQYVPVIAPMVQQLTIFQRSANYLLPRNQVEFSEEELDAFEADPSLFKASRAEIHAFREESFARLRHDSAAQAQSVLDARAHLESQVADPSLREKLTPDYEYGCKRVLRSDDYYPALMRPNVSLETQRIERFSADGIVTVEGAHHPFDVVIFGTGFKSQEFQGSVEVTGRDGLLLNDRWETAQEAYLGMVVDGFPNMFIIYGPNTNLNHNSIVSMMEAQQAYIIQSVAYLTRHPADVLDVREKVLTRFNQKVQQELQSSAFTSDCSSWYKNADGRVVNNWSGTVDDYRRLTLELDRHDYVVGRT